MNNELLCDLSSLGFISISGIDAAKFLQGQLTCDVREINISQSRLGAHCDQKGRMQFSFRIFQYQDNYYLLLPKSLIPHALNCLQKYAIFSKVKLQDASHEWVCMGLNGPHCHDYLTEICGRAPKEVDEILALQDLVIIQIPGINPRFLMMGNSEKITALQQKLQVQTKQTDFNSWLLLDIYAGIATIFPETVGLFTPHDLNYPNLNGVSFNKGCYTGQEIVARMHYLGKLKQHLFQIKFTIKKPPQPGTKMFGDDSKLQQVGTLVISAQKNNDGYQALAVLPESALTKTIYLGESVIEVVN